MFLSERAIVALAVIPKVSASLSMAGSLSILHGVLSADNRNQLPYHRLLAGMSLADFILSFGYFLGTWPMPRDTIGVYGAVGTQATCTAAGFFNLWTAPVGPMYNAALALYYLATVRYNWTDRKVAQIEKFLHPIFWLIGLGFAFIGLWLKLFNNTENIICIMEHKPIGCLDSFRHGKDAANCERGDNAYIYQWAFVMCFGWASFLIMVCSLIHVYFAVLNIENRIQSYSFPSEDQEQDRKKSRRVFEQGLMYGIAFVLTWMMPTLGRILFLMKKPLHVAMKFLFVIFVPLQGFWNCLIYNRALRSTLFSVCLCRFSTGSESNPNSENTTNTEVSENCNDGQPRTWLSFRWSRRSNREVNGSVAGETSNPSRTPTGLRNVSPQQEAVDDEGDVHHISKPEEDIEEKSAEELILSIK